MMLAIPPHSRAVGVLWAVPAGIPPDGLGDVFSPSFVRERVGLRSGEISLQSLAPAWTALKDQARMMLATPPHSRVVGVLWAAPAGLKSVHLITNRTGMSPSLVCNVSSDRK
jgi:hypothetical protein